MISTNATAKTLRDLVLDAISMKNKGKTPFEIYQHIVHSARKLGQIDPCGDENNFEIRLVKTGQVIRLNHGDYSYSTH